MQLTYFDSKTITSASVARPVKALSDYREFIQQVIVGAGFTEPESALAAWRDIETATAIADLGRQFRSVKHVILIGIGGSSLGTEAIHSVLATLSSPRLHVLDTISAFELAAVLEAIELAKKPEHLAICVVSKSGTTTETLANAAVLLDALADKFGSGIYAQTVFVGERDSALLRAGRKLGGHAISMPTTIGGRYSVFTAAGLVPLQLLGHDIDALLNGLQDATKDHFEAAVAESAARLFAYLKAGVRTVNFFAFDTRLVRLGKWYRQLAAESLGKAKGGDGKRNQLGFIPTISTPVELHSMGQLYFSGWPGVYTDFVVFDDSIYDFEIPKTTKLAPTLKRKSLQEIQAAMYGGVIGAYQERALPYRATQFDDELTYSLGLFMGMRMLETMYLASLMGVDAFDQPNVERYKEITKQILAA